MMKELRRRASSTESCGMACGPFSVYAIDAEIVVEDEGSPVYLHSQWVDQASDMLYFEATTVSIYDEEMAINETSGTGEDFEEALEKRNRLRAETELQGIDAEERYAEQYEQLIDMIQEVLDHDGVSFHLRESLNGDDGWDDADDEDEDEA